MNYKKKNIFVISVLIIVVLIYVFSPKIGSYLRWQRAADAAGGYPTEFGITGTVNTLCYLSCPSESGPKCCQGGSLCSIKTPELPRCVLYTDVKGAPAGGDGNNILLLNTAIAKAGLSPGGQLIAGCAGPTLCDSGVLASSGGCWGSGCTAIETGPIEKFKNWFAIKINSFIIAGINDN